MLCKIYKWRVCVCRPSSGARVPDRSRRLLLEKKKSSEEEESGWASMTTIVVKETLRKCPSDPVRLSTPSSASTSKSSPSTPSRAATASGSSSPALHLAPFSKCVLTLDGYNYVISKLLFVLVTESAHILRRALSIPPLV